jgi:hypothetical protein
VKWFIEEGRARAEKLLQANLQALDRIATGLVEYETLSRAEMETLMRGEKLDDSRLKVSAESPMLIPSMGVGAPAPPAGSLPASLLPKGKGAGEKDGGQKPSYPA